MVLKEVSKSLKVGGRFLIDIMNIFWLFKNFQHEMWTVIDDLICLEQNEFNPITMRTRHKRIIFQKGKGIDRREHEVRHYTPGEISFLMKLAGLKPIKFYGDWRNFSEYSENSGRLIVVAEKKEVS